MTAPIRPVRALSAVAGTVAVVVLAACAPRATSSHDAADPATERPHSQVAVEPAVEPAAEQPTPVGSESGAEAADTAYAPRATPGSTGPASRQDQPESGSILPRPEDDPTPPSADPGAVVGGSSRNAISPRTFKRTIPGTAVDYVMVYVPAGTVRMTNEDGEEVQVEVGPFWIGQHELSWDMYDVYVFNFDQPGEHPEADAVSRPSRPYIPPDRGFGHAGYPAISMTTQGAEKFCEWLSKKTGRTYRVPTPAEWKYAALAGSEGPYCFGDDVAQLPEYAWFDENAEEKTQPSGQKKPNAWGICDMHGNVMEWVRTQDGWIACGGSWRQDAEGVTADATAEQDWEWNMTDPQIPKSPWWLSDASWVGMRLICEDETVGEQPQAEQEQTP